MNKSISTYRESKAGPRVLRMQELYKQEVLTQLDGAAIIGNHQYVIIDDFITTQERDDMYK